MDRYRGTRHEVTMASCSGSSLDRLWMPASGRPDSINSYPDRASFRLYIFRSGGLYRVTSSQASDVDVVTDERQRSRRRYQQTTNIAQARIHSFIANSHNVDCVNPAVAVTLRMHICRLLCIHALVAQQFEGLSEHGCCGFNGRADMPQVFRFWCDASNLLSAAEHTEQFGIYGQHLPICEPPPWVRTHAWQRRKRRMHQQGPGSAS